MKHRTNCFGEWRVGDMVIKHGNQLHKLLRKCKLGWSTKGVSHCSHSFIKYEDVEKTKNISEIARAAGREI